MKLLDLFCGAGGAAMGYYLAGFDEIIGIDINPQPRYPFRFIQADALNPPVNLCEFDLIHSSPPCQAYSWAANRWKREYPDLISPVREMLKGSNYIIENVAGAPLIKPVRLCGSIFGLRVIRHRYFEVSFAKIKVPQCHHAGSVKNGDYVTVVGHGCGSKDCRLATWREAMGIAWMTRKELTQAVPPAFTKFLGAQIKEFL